MVKEDLSSGTELFCDYGFLDQYVKGENMFNTIMDVGKVLISNNDEKQFKSDMKYTVKYMKKQFDDYKPYIEMIRNMYNMINK